MNLRARLLLILLLALALPAGLMGWRFYQERTIEIGQAQVRLSSLARRIGDEIDTRIQGTAQLQYGLSRAHDLDTTDRAACSEFLSAVREEYPQYTGILTIRPDGALFCDSLRTGRQLDLRDREYFKQAQMLRGAVALQPAFGRLTGLSVLQIAYPVHEGDGPLKYVLLASLNLDKFTVERQREFIAPRPQLLLVDRKGGVLAWSGEGTHRQVPGTSITDAALLRLATQPNGSAVAEIVDAQGRAQVWATDAAQVDRRSGIHVLVGLPKAELVAAADRRLVQDLGFLGLIALLLFAAMWVLAELGIRRPVGRITEMARQLGSGRLEARIPGPYPRGELGGLMAVLNSTANSLQRQRADIEQLGQQLRQSQKLEAIGTLAGGIAHDFNNVLGAILGNVALARDDLAVDHPAERSLTQIEVAASRARDLVQQILAFSRQQPPALVTLSLRPLVDDILGLLRVTLPPGITLNTELAEAPLHVRADATQLHQVLMNLCANAWQSLQGQPGQVTVGLAALWPADARAAGITVGDVSSQTPIAHLWVRDSGCGIDEATRLRIFEPFFTTKPAGAGTGLGLSVVHGIVMGHGGALTVDSAPGQGSTFHVYLPTVNADPSAADAEAERRPPAAWSGQGQRVLYVDDDEVMKVLVERLLTRAGYRPLCHGSVQQALTTLLADPMAWDVVVTDYSMPELSGVEFARQLLAIRPDLPVIVMSGYVSDELRLAARAGGVREVIQKQYTLEELGSAIHRVLADRG
ncbi:MAG: response regulator [Burkholderiaceae bacterium]|nr:response regulator [Burkholderiaceae bacterium]